MNEATFEPRSDRRRVLQCAIVAGTGVALGALGAHALEARIGESMSTYRTAVLYQLVHGVAGLALVSRGTRASRIAIDLFTVGAILFSGSLYGLVLLENASFLGPVTPLGGVCFLVGWVFAARS